MPTLLVYLGLASGETNLSQTGWLVERSPEVQVGLKGIEMEMEKHSKRMQTIMKEANEVLQLIEELEDDQGSCNIRI